MTADEDRPDEYAPPRHARGEQEHAFRTVRDLRGHERYDSRRDVAPRRHPLAMPLRDRTKDSGSSSRATYWVTLRNMRRSLLIVERVLE